MKRIIFALTAIFGLNAFAGLDDFNSIIQENQKSQLELQNRLQKEAGIELRDESGMVAKEKRFVPTETEQIVVSTSDELLAGPRKKAAVTDEKAEMSRISQELNELNN